MLFDIPFPIRISKLSRDVTAMLKDKPYQPRKNKDQLIEELRRGFGTVWGFTEINLMLHQFGYTWTEDEQRQQYLLNVQKTLEPDEFAAVIFSTGCGINAINICNNCQKYEGLSKFIKIESINAHVICSEQDQEDTVAALQEYVEDKLMKKSVQKVYACNRENIYILSNDNILLHKPLLSTLQ